MTHKAIMVCIAALAVAAASTAAQAAKPVSKERQAALAKIEQNHRNFKTPRTVAEAARTKAVLPNGATVAAVPEELWTEISAQVDAQGRVQMREADGSAAATATTVEVEAHE